MSPAAGFVVFFSATLVSLAIAALSGRTGRRRAHVACVVAAVLLLGVTVYYALELGKIRDLPAAGIITPIHLTLAKLTTASYLAPIWLGIQAWRARGASYPAARKLHATVGWSVLALTVLTAITGTIMILNSPPLVPPH